MSSEKVTLSFALLPLAVVAALPVEGLHQGASLISYINTTLPSQGANLTINTNVTINANMTIIPKYHGQDHLQSGYAWYVCHYLQQRCNATHVDLVSYPLLALLTQVMLSASSPHYSPQLTHSHGADVSGKKKWIANTIASRMRVPFMTTCPDPHNGDNTAFSRYSDIWHAINQFDAMFNEGNLSYLLPYGLGIDEALPMHDCSGPLWEFQLLQNGATWGLNDVVNWWQWGPDRIIMDNCGRLCNIVTHRGGSFNEFYLCAKNGHYRA